MMNKKLDAFAKILLIRRDNIGDLVCTTPLIASLRKKYPSSDIRIITNSYNHEVVIGNPCLNKIYVYTKSKHCSGFCNKLSAIFDKISLVFELKRWKADVAILCKASYDKQGLSLARLIGVREVIGFCDERHNSKYITIPIKTKNFDAQHEVEFMSDLGKAIGIDEKPGNLEIYTNSKADTERVNKIFEEQGKVYAFHVSSREKGREFPADKCIELLNQLLDVRHDFKIAVIWAPGLIGNKMHPGDDLKADTILSMVCNDRVIGYAPQSITELISFLKKCSGFLGADGGALHIAAALNVPILGFYENRTDKTLHWYPWKVSHKLLVGKNEAVSTIPNEEIVREFMNIFYP